MQNFRTNKQIKISAIGLAILAMTGCIGTKYLSEGITDTGQVQTQNIIFPKVEDAWQKEGHFVNRENLSYIQPSIGKDTLYQLIGRPHFSEAQYAREWDYLLKFHMPDGAIKVCQYKVIFDKQYKGQEFYWNSSDCPPDETIGKQ